MYDRDPFMDQLNHLITALFIGKSSPFQESKKGQGNLQRQRPKDLDFWTSYKPAE